MIHLRLASLLLVCVAGAATAATPTADPRTAALQQYKHDLVSVLALRADASHLLGAALLAGSLDENAPGLDFTKLLARAAAADPDNTAVAWTRLSDCDRKAQNCPNEEALDRLKELASNNAAIWILALDAAARDGDHEAQLLNLHKAADAGGYNDYGGAILKALTLAATALPVPEDTVRAYVGASSSKAGPASAQVFLAYGQMTTQLQPSFLPVMALCDPKVNDEAGQLLGDCRKLGHVLAWGSSPQARAAGLHLQDILASSKSARRQAKAEMHDLVWQLRNYSRLALKALADQDLALEMLRLGQSGGSEVSRINALLQRQDIPTQAPPDNSDTSPHAAPEPAASAAMPAEATSIAAPAQEASVAAPAHAATVVAPATTESASAPARAASRAVPASPTSSATPATAAATSSLAESGILPAAASSAVASPVPESSVSHPATATSLASPANSASIAPPAPSTTTSAPAPAGTSAVPASPTSSPQPDFWAW